METSSDPSLAPRPPNTGELAELGRWLSGQGYEPDEARLTAQSAYVAVYDKYISGSPGFVGKLMSVVWDGGPSIFDVFIWEDGAMTCVDRDNGE